MSQEETPPPTILLHLEDGDTTHVVPLKREHAIDFIRSILLALGPNTDGFGYGPPIALTSHITIGHNESTKTAMVGFDLSGLGIGIRIDAPKLLQLRSEIDRVLNSITPPAAGVH